MTHSVSEIVEIFEILRSTVLRVFRKYLMEDIPTHRGQHSGQLRVLNARYQMYKTRIACGNRHATLKSRPHSVREEPDANEADQFSVLSLPWDMVVEVSTG